MKRPLVRVAVLYLGGILLGEHIAIPVGAGLALTALLAATALFWNRARVHLLVPLIILAGVTNLRIHRAVLSPVDLQKVMQDRTEWVKVRGRLTEDPASRIYWREEIENYRTLARLEVAALRRDRKEWESVTGLIAVILPEILDPPLWKGQVVEIEGILEPPSRPQVKGLFDYRAFLRNEGIHYQLKTESAHSWEAVPPRIAPSIAARFGSWARTTLARGLPEEDEPLRLLWAMTLGWRTGLTGEVSEPFMRSGTLHVFAISGLHVAMVSGILVLLLRVFKVPRGACGLVVIPLLWFYAAVTGWPPSAVRATIMMTIIIGGWALHRPSDLLNSLAAAGVVILLLWDPLQVFQASFQLSFSVVLSLALFGPVLRRIGQGLWRPDPFLPDELRPSWQRYLGKIGRGGLAACVTSLAAWLGSVPLVAHYFHLFTPVSLLVNPVIVLLAMMALISSLGSLIFGAWWVAVSELLNHSAWFFMSLMSWVSRRATEIPGAWWNVKSPVWPGLLLYYGMLFTWMTRGSQRTWHRWLALVFLSFSAAWWISGKVIASTQTRLTVIPLSGGHAIYVDDRDSKNDFLIDCGDDPSAEAVLSPFLKSQGVNRLPGLVLTHGDVRHVGGAGRIQEQFPAQRIWMGSLQFRSSIYRQLKTEFQEKSEWLRFASREDRIASWKVLHPDTSDSYSQADDASLVLWRDFAGVRVLLLSDLGKPGQARLLERYPDLRAEIVVTGLPAKSAPVDTGLLHALQPKLLIVADTLYPATERASRELQARLAATRIPVFYTRESGAVEVVLSGGEWKIVPALQTSKVIEP